MAFAMATKSVIRACQLKFAAIPAGGFPGGVLPALYFDEAPQTDGSGAQVQPTTQGYAVIRSKGAAARAYAFGSPLTREDAEVEIEFFYPSLGDCSDAAEATRAAFDYGALPDLDPSFTLLAIRPRSNRPSRAGLGKTGVPVHSWVLGYRIEILR